MACIQGFCDGRACRRCHGGGALTATWRSVLVTGGTGFFGRAFVRRLLDENHCGRVCVFSRGEFQQAQMEVEFNFDARLRFLIGDVRDYDRLRMAMQGVQLVVHAAALKRVGACEYNPIEAIKTNVEGAKNVALAATDAGVERVVFLSSDKACNPLNLYGSTKLTAEKMFLDQNRARGAYGPRFAAVRYGNVWQSTGSVVPMWREILKTSDTVPVTDPECTRFFMTREQAVDLVLRTAKTMEGGELAIPELPAYRLGDLAEAMGAKMKIVGLPASEKKDESMREGESSDRARRMTVDELREALRAA